MDLLNRVLSPLPMEDTVRYFFNGIDFLIIALLIYGVLYFFRGTKSANVLGGIVVILILAWILAHYLQFRVLLFLLEKFWTIFGIAIVVIFQPELRRFFAQVGGIFVKNNVTSDKVIDSVVDAVEKMSEEKTGALIVFQQNIGLDGIVRSSIMLDAEVNSMLLRTIFFKNSPLHDLAVVIRGNKIVAARAVLPLTPEEGSNPARLLGSRHRAAVGITEESDAVAVVVSEETGSIGVANKGRLLRGYSKEELKEQLTDLLADRGWIQAMTDHLHDHVRAESEEESVKENDHE